MSVRPKLKLIQAYYKTLPNLREPAKAAAAAWSSAAACRAAPPT